MIDINTKIEDINLSVKTFNKLKRDGISTIGEYFDKKEEYETCFPKIAQEVQQKISDFDSTNRTIVYIDIDRIKPHPDNPRKDVGDVSELAESIKQNGIMQNLTIIPSEVQGKYIALIGHRRLAAAKVAGLDKVPCAVVGNLSRSEQVSIMLAENMQRADLTLYEQAEGLQMMLDLGDTVSTITKKTGMSETTVRRRLSLMQYDREAVKASVERGASIADYDEIKKIKDKARQDKLINSIGTNNFKWELKQALDDQKREEKKQQLIDFVKGFAKELEKDADLSKLKNVKTFYSVYYGNPELPKDYDENLNYYFSTIYNQLIIYTDYTQAEYDEAEQRRAAQQQRAAKEAELTERRKKLDEISAAMLKSRVEFLKDFKGIPQEKAVDKLCVLYDINRIITEVLNGNYSSEFNWEDIIEEFYPEIEEPLEHIGEYLEKVEPDKLIIINFLASVGFFDKISISNWMCEYRKSFILESIYKVLEMIGYKMSETEREYLNGTHEAFVKRRSDNDPNSSDSR